MEKELRVCFYSLLFYMESKYRFKTKEEFVKDGMWNDDTYTPSHWSSDGSMNKLLGKNVDPEHNDDCDKNASFTYRGSFHILYTDYVLLPGKTKTEPKSESSSNEKFKKGDKVLISDDSEHKSQGIGEDGNKMIGTIKAIRDVLNIILYVVDWSNGVKNVYKEKDLILYNKESKFSVEDRVLISDDSPYSHQGKIGDRKMIGVIQRIKNDAHPYWVRWSNDDVNGYRETDIIPYTDSTKRFLENDKVIISKDSKYYHQQKFDDDKKPIPLEIIEVYDELVHDEFYYECSNDSMYSDLDLEPYSP